MFAYESAAFRYFRWTGEALAAPPITGGVASSPMGNASPALGQHGQEMHLARTSSFPLQFTRSNLNLRRSVSHYRVTATRREAATSETSGVGFEGIRLPARRQRDSVFETMMSCSKVIAGAIGAAGLKEKIAWHATSPANRDGAYPQEIHMATVREFHVTKYP
jgi:hypothetical protein